MAFLVDVDLDRDRHAMQRTFGCCAAVKCGCFRPCLIRKTFNDGIQFRIGGFHPRDRGFGHFRSTQRSTVRRHCDIGCSPLPREVGPSCRNALCFACLTRSDFEGERNVRHHKFSCGSLSLPISGNRRARQPVYQSGLDFVQDFDHPCLPNAAQSDMNAVQGLNEDAIRLSSSAR